MLEAVMLEETFTHMYGLNVFTKVTPFIKFWYIQNIAVLIQIWVTWGKISSRMIKSIYVSSVT